MQNHKSQIYQAQLSQSFLLTYSGNRLNRWIMVFETLQEFSCNDHVRHLRRGHERK